MKKQSDLSRLMGYAGNYRYFTYASWVLSAVSALVALVPFVYIWKILRDVLNTAPNYAQAVNIPHYGWMAVLFAVLSYLIYIAALMCSHLSAFRVATNLRLAASEHLAVLPLGFTENFGSGKLRKIIPEGTGAADLSGPPVARPVQRHRHPGGAAGAAAGVRLAAGAAEPCAGGAGFPHYDDHDWQADG